MKKITSLMMGLLMCGSVAFANEVAPDHIALKPVFDHVFDAGTYSTLNYELGKASLAKNFGGDGGKCTAVVKNLPNGDTVVGRNMDFYITHKPAYVVRTKGVEGEYDTIGLTYDNARYPDNDYVKANGLQKSLHEVLPFYNTDVLNEKGLYVEVNMRLDETGKDGKPVFASSGTNPKSKERVSVVMLPRYLGARCATVDEAVALAKKLDIYSINAPGMNWSLCLLMADATGNYGLLEIAQNKLSFLKKQPAQSNFYITKSLNKKQHYKAGVGRYDTVMNGVKDVKTDDDMFKLIKKVSYWQCNFPEICQYDARTELVQDDTKWTTDFVLDPKNAEEVNAKQEEDAVKLRTMTREQIMDEGCYWASIFTNVVNCNKKTLTVRFFEEENKVMTFGFDK